MGLKMILRKGTLALSYRHTDISMNAVVALAQAEFWPSWVSSWGQANWYLLSRHKEDFPLASVVYQVKTPIGKIFYKLLDHHFPKEHPLYKIINRNTVKIVRTQRNSTQLKTTLKQLALELDIVVSCSPPHPPQTFQPLLVILGVWNFVCDLT